MEDKIWDPLRKKHVARTPEEEVRQWFISVMISGMKIPSHMMMSEVPIRFGDKDYRADIVAYGRDASPLMIVECKQPSVAIDQKVLDQERKAREKKSSFFISYTGKMDLPEEIAAAVDCIYCISGVKEELHPILS